MLLKLTKFDIIFQLKQGFYLIYAILTAIYLLILFYLPQQVRAEVTAYLILSDTSIMGLVFVGAIVLLEKQQNILQSMFITPLKLSTYLWSKAISLTFIALAVSTAIGIIPGGMKNNIPGLFISVIGSSLFFTFLGLGISAGANTLNQYLAGIMVGGLIMVAPIVLFFLTPQIAFIFPINAAVELLLGKILTLTFEKVLINGFILAIWTTAAYLFAYKRFEKQIIQK